MRKNALQPKQEKFIRELTKYLKNYPGRSISVTSIPYADKEKEYILFFEAKKMYYKSTNNLHNKLLTKNDTMLIDRIAIKDSFFVRYLDGKTGEKLLFTIQDKCEKLIGLDKISLLFNKLNAERQRVFLSYFKDENVGNRIKFKLDINRIPYNGFSFCKIEYKGEWPENLKEAYFKMIDLNKKTPRNKFARDLMRLGTQ